MNPEFLKEGSSVNDTLNPHLIVIGCNKKSDGIILEKLKEVCSQSTAKNLMMGANYGIQGSSAASLHTVPENLISEYEQILFDFITFANKSISSVVSSSLTLMTSFSSNLSHA